MYAKQYEMTLPADYDMGVIRERVAAGGHVLDDRAGLGLKAYLIRERGEGGSPVNQYAPFYLWNDAGAMGEFLFGGGGFQNIIRDFGRPEVRQWTGVACHAGPSRSEVPKVATRRVRQVPVDSDRRGTGMGLSAWIGLACGDLKGLSETEGVHTAALAVDPHRWEAVEFVLWNAHAPEDPAAERYEVLHVSEPGLDGLPEGRAW
ncbi:DUF4865 family protein [Salininema proteolyticum]|uniref:DUF4865 family protein n=1 Tax=Salininema proteolyticum TaxID=1607685 RepID=A0ABV8TYN9_9ACTN